MSTMIPPLSSHAVFWVLVQVAVLLLVSRLFAEGARRLNQPAVIGELLAGLVLGPSLLGFLAPSLSSALFPLQSTQFHLLEIISWIGVVFLLLLTGLETDIRLLRGLGRPVLFSTILGLLVPFVGGTVVGLLLPEALLPQPEKRLLVALFVATALSVTAMPVLAKVLMDLKLTQRNIGLIMLSAGMVKDAIGWLILSVIAGISESGHFAPARFAFTVSSGAGIILLSKYGVFPLLKKLFRQLDAKWRTPYSDTAFIVIATFLYAGLMEFIGLHAVFGAFIAGILVRQIPTLRDKAVQGLHAVTMAVFAPIFFAIAGLRVDLAALHDWPLLLLFLAVAFGGKLLGSLIGGRLAGLTLIESLSIGAGMSILGAMGLIVALIGFSIGLLSTEVYTMLVIVVIATSLFGPPLLSVLVRFVALTPEEKLREGALKQAFVLLGQPLKILLPTTGALNALSTIKLLIPWGRREGTVLTVLHVDRVTSRWRFWKSWREARARRSDIQDHFSALAAHAAAAGVKLEFKRAEHRHVADAIVEEASRDYNLIVLGAPEDKDLWKAPVIEEVVEQSPCHVVIAKNRYDALPERIAVPMDGSYCSRVAVELALLFAEAGQGEIVLLHVVRRDPAWDYYPDEADALQAVQADQAIQKNLERAMDPYIAKSQRPIRVEVLEGRGVEEGVLRYAESHAPHLIVLGAENRAVQMRLFLGLSTEKILEETSASVAVIIPKI